MTPIRGGTRRVADLRGMPVVALDPLPQSPSGPAVVAIGGGHGLAQALRAMTRYAGRITAIVTVADDGGSSGRLAPALDIPPPGDIRQCLLALTPAESVWRRLFDHRFETGDVEGHSLGNLILAALSALEGDFELALREAERLLGSVGAVIPAAPERLRLHASIEGSNVAGQVAIALHRGKIDALHVEPRGASAGPSAVDAIRTADQIVLGPGSLYTSIMAVLVVPGIVDAVNDSSAELVYVANLITQDGETLGMDCADHLQALLDITGIRQPGTIVANKVHVSVEPPLEPLVVEPEVVETYGVDVVLADVADPDADWPRHDPARLAAVLDRLISNQTNPGGAHP
ncbi:MAG: uridine diphosphate-N-acetylglucosamine-binding protein YvcK [Acidimicrobiia bacterium]